MGKVWVLDTSTKGTGATMVPLEQALPGPSKQAESVLVARPSRPEPLPKPQPPPPPRMFKIVDLLTRQVLTERADARAAIEVLKDVRSIVDVDVYAWQPKNRKWRRLTFDEQRMLWSYRDRNLAVRTDR